MAARKKVVGKTASVINEVREQELRNQLSYVGEQADNLRHLAQVMFPEFKGLMSESSSAVKSLTASSNSLMTVLLQLQNRLDVTGSCVEDGAEKSIGKLVKSVEDLGNKMAPVKKDSSRLQAKDALYALKLSLSADPDFAWGWHCNVTMAAFDEGLNLPAANRAGARFMKLAFGVDMTQNERFPATQDRPVNNA